MTLTELTSFEKQLEVAGYKKYTSCLSDKESWGWFKSSYEANLDEYDEKVRRYTIEFRVWDFSQYAHRDEYLQDNPYSIDTLILDGDSSYRIDLNITSPKFDIETTENIAEDLHNMLSKYVKNC